MSPPCPDCGLELRPLPPPGVWPNHVICDNGHRWKLPLPLTFKPSWWTK